MDSLCHANYYVSGTTICVLRKKQREPSNQSTVEIFCNAFGSGNMPEDDTNDIRSLLRIRLLWDPPYIYLFRLHYLKSRYIQTCYRKETDTIIVQVIGHIYFWQFSKNRQKIVLGDYSLKVEIYELWLVLFLFVWLFIFIIVFPTFWSLSNKLNYFIYDQLNILDWIVEIFHPSYQK